MQRRAARLSAGAAVVVAVLFTVPAGAQQARPATLRITVDHATAVPLDASAGAVLIADPAIADIVTERGHLVFVVGKKLGATNLLVYDGAGKRLAEREVIVVPPELEAVTITRATDQTDYTCAPRCAFREHLASGAALDNAAAASPTLPSLPPPPMPAMGLPMKP
jgi:Flp pilus assembly secretin CpaC